MFTPEHFSGQEDRQAGLQKSPRAPTDSKYAILHATVCRSVDASFAPHVIIVADCHGLGQASYVGARRAQRRSLEIN
jgi:hypothetical protein